MATPLLATTGCSRSDRYGGHVKKCRNRESHMEAPVILYVKAPVCLDSIQQDGRKRTVSISDPAPTGNRVDSPASSEGIDQSAVPVES